MTAHSARRVRRDRGARQAELTDRERRLDARVRLYYCHLVRMVFMTLFVVAYIAFEIVQVAEGHEPVAQTLMQMTCALR